MGSGASVPQRSVAYPSLRLDGTLWFFCGASSWCNGVGAITHRVTPARMQVIEDLPPRPPEAGIAPTAPAGAPAAAPPAAEAQSTNLAAQSTAPAPAPAPPAAPDSAVPASDRQQNQQPDQALPPSEELTISGLSAKQQLPGASVPATTAGLLAPMYASAVAKCYALDSHAAQDTICSGAAESSRIEGGSSSDVMAGPARPGAEEAAGLCSSGASDILSRSIAAPVANAVLAAVASSAQEIALATDRLVEDGKHVLQPSSSNVGAAEGSNGPHELRDAAGGAVAGVDGASTWGAIAGQKRPHDDISPVTGDEVRHQA